jgi:uncharacterized protein (DUF2249 family)
MDNYKATVDVRELAPSDKQSTIFETFDTLEPGETMELINDHDPRPLRFMLIAEMPGKFEWNYLKEGPKIWKVAITKKG